ncbi:MAG TPA: LemA family protein [Candidatus Thermoplasmatota archaeon]|nr:LemA family protein [Candidatus Thermoplasmatota archaeon]
MAVGPVLVALALVAISLLLWIVILYNRLVGLENAIDRAWANVDVILKQRNDEVPNLVATVKGYATHERALFEAVAHARAVVASEAAATRERATASADLSAGVARLLAVGEAYPDLKANESFLALQKRLSGLEDVLADRREFYNQSVVLFNTRIREIPDTWLARRMRLQPKAYFKADAGDRAVPDLS